MKANPGGQVGPQDVVGRDGLIQRLWGALGRQSVALVAERRMGKTVLAKKMAAEGPNGVLTIWQDLERCHSPLEFVEAVLHEVQTYLGRFRKNALRVRAFIAELGGVEIAGMIRLPESLSHQWKPLLVRTMEDLAEHQQGLVVFFWDELPLMLKNVKERLGEETAMELLDTLRAVRQTHTQIRMFFTGSIGLHNVITSLKRKGYANAPVNDMHIVELPPLDLPDAAELARRLLEGEGIEVELDSDLPRAIAESVGRIPYYIHHVVAQMKERGGEWSGEAVAALVSRCLTDDHDVWELEHYRSRIDVYYDADDRPFVLGLLDVLAGADGPLHFAELFDLLKSQIVTEDRERTRELLTLLRRDHYLTQDEDGRFRFRFPLIRRWWRLRRGLTQ